MIEPLDDVWDIFAFVLFFALKNDQTRLGLSDTYIHTASMNFAYLSATRFFKLLVILLSFAFKCSEPVLLTFLVVSLFC